MRTINFNEFVSYCKRQAETCRRMEKHAVKDKNYEEATRANESADLYSWLAEVVSSTDPDDFPSFLEVIGEELE